LRVVTVRRATREPHRAGAEDNRQSAAGLDLSTDDAIGAKERLRPAGIARKPARQEQRTPRRLVDAGRIRQTRHERERERIRLPRDLATANGVVGAELVDLSHR